MPSGSKKRKAAKKKKEQATNNVNSSTNNNPYGNEKSQDERDSDGGSVDSPASQDGHNSHQHPFNHREEERKRDESSVTEGKSVEEATRDAESTEKSGLDGVETTHVRIQHVEHDKSSSSSSSSEDESQTFEKKSKEKAYDHGSEKTSYGNEDKLATVMSAEVLKVAENGTHGVESRFKEGEEKLLPSSNGNSKVEMEGNEEKVIPSSSVPTAETSYVVENPQDSEPHDHSKKPPPVASAPPMVQRTSLLSCCGLFDVLTGSGR